MFKLTLRKKWYDDYNPGIVVLAITGCGVLAEIRMAQTQQDGCYYSEEP